MSGRAGSAAALRDQRVAELIVVETMPAVIRWHREGLVPLGPVLTGDERCRFEEGDFFALAADPETGFDPERPGRRFNAVLLDIDHSPDKLLSRSHAAFYTCGGLEAMAGQLRPGAVFAMWSDDPPDERFLGLLGEVFEGVRAEVVAFPNPILERDSESTVYVARKRGE